MEAGEELSCSITNWFIPTIDVGEFPVALAINAFEASERLIDKSL